MPINPSPSLSPLKSPPTKGILDGTLLILANGTRVPSILVNSENPYTPEIDIPRELSNIGKSLFALITPSFMKIPFEFIFISADAFLNSIPELASRVKFGIDIFKSLAKIGNFNIENSSTFRFPEKVSIPSKFFIKAEYFIGPPI